MQIPLVQPLLAPPGRDGKDMGCAAPSKLLTAGCYVRAKSSVSVLVGGKGEGLLPVAGPGWCR